MLSLLLAAVQTFCNPMSIPDTPISHECWKLKHGDVIERDKLPAWSYGSWQYEENGAEKGLELSLASFLAFDRIGDLNESDDLSVAVDAFVVCKHWSKSMDSRSRG